MTEVSSSGDLETTDLRYHDATRSLILKFRLLGILPALIIAGVLWLVHPVAAVIGLVVVSAAWIFYTMSRLQGIATHVLSGLSTQVVSRHDQPRLWNLVDGLCITSGVAQPEIRMVADSTLNAFVVDDGDDAVVIITQGLVERLDRIGLEAVLAHLLIRVKDGSAEYYTTVLRLLGASARGQQLLQATFGTHWSLRHDLEAVSLTRYPPGMISALSTIQTVGSHVDSRPSGSDSLWFANPSASTDATNDTLLQSVAFRQAVLEEL